MILMCNCFLGKKYANLNGVVIIPELNVPKMHGGIKAVRHDFTLLKEPTGEWRKKYE